MQTFYSVVCFVALAAPATRNYSLRGKGRSFRIAGLTQTAARFRAAVRSRVFGCCSRVGTINARTRSKRFATQKTLKAPSFPLRCLLEAFLSPFPLFFL